MKILKTYKKFSFEIENTPKNNPNPENTIPIPKNIKIIIISEGTESGKIINITMKNAVKGIIIPKNSEII